MRDCICGHEEDAHDEVWLTEDGEIDDDPIAADEADGSWEDWCWDCNDGCTFDEMSEGEAGG